MRAGIFFPAYTYFNYRTGGKIYDLSVFELAAIFYRAELRFVKFRDDIKDDKWRA